MRDSKGRFLPQKLKQSETNYIFIENLDNKESKVKCTQCKQELIIKDVYCRRSKTGTCKICRDNKHSDNIKSHGMSTNPLYKKLNGMITRCYNPNSKDYSRYGGRGITICDEWLNDFMSFYKWCNENGYKKELSIDRIDNDGNYEPNNCRFTNKNIQQRNSTKICKRNKTGYRGVRIDRGRIRSQIVVNSKTIHLGYSKTLEDGAMLYDKYIDDNNLEHTKNF